MKRFIKKFLPRTLFGRSLLILVVPILIIQIVTTFMFFDRHWSGMTDRLGYAVGGEINLIANEIERDPNGPVWRETANEAFHTLSLQVTYTPGAHLPPVTASPEGYNIVEQTMNDALAMSTRRPFTVTVDRPEKWVRVEMQLQGGVLHIMLPQGRLFSSSGYIFLMWVIGTSMILLAVAVLFMRNQIRPIRRLAVAAERFGRGLDMPTSFKPEGAREVRQASQAFIDMHGRIRRQIQQRTAMLAGVSHDLRTPLTRMKLQTAMLEDSPDVEALKGDIVDMERMIDAYLDFARGEGGEASSRTDLRDILERVAGGARRQGAVVHMDAIGDLSLQLRPVAFERCLSNLVGNARQYANTVWLGATREEDSVIITVDDDGPGVPEHLLDEVFKPFVRGEPSRNPATGGVGLGLPIAQDIVHAHGGKIRLEKSSHGGLRAWISLPV